jgi:hypothetical protein
MSGFLVFERLPRGFAASAFDMRRMKRADRLGAPQAVWRVTAMAAD